MPGFAADAGTLNLNLHLRCAQTDENKTPCYGLNLNSCRKHSFFTLILSPQNNLLTQETLENSSIILLKTPGLDLNMALKYPDSR